jgi:HSP20 family protein
MWAAAVAKLFWSPFADWDIPVETYADGDRFVVRAELAGLDPTRDIQLAVVDGELRIRAERSATCPSRPGRPSGTGRSPRACRCR